MFASVAFFTKGWFGAAGRWLVRASLYVDTTLVVVDRSSSVDSGDSGKETSPSPFAMVKVGIPLSSVHEADELPSLYCRVREKQCRSC